MKPKFYSKKAIGILTLIFTPLLGSILFSFNLKEVNKGKIIPIFIIVGLFWTYIFKKLTVGVIDNILIQLIVSNIIGSLIFTFFLWNKFFVDYPEYEKKKVWKPVIIFIVICLVFILISIAGMRK